MDAPDFRPLGIGEILDRAIALYVRRFALFFLALALISIPVVLVQVVADPGGATLFSDIGEILAKGNDPDAMRVLRQRTQAHERALAGPALLAFLAAPLEMIIASVIAFASFLGAAPTLRGAFRAAFARFLGALAVSLGYVVIACGCFIAAFVVFIPVSLGVGLLFTGSKLAGSIVGTVAGLAFVATMLFLISVVTLAWRIALVAVATEDGSPFRAIGCGLRRTFARALLLRSFLVGLTAFVVEFAGIVVGLSAGAVIGALTHVPDLAVVISTLAGIILTGLVTTFIVRYTLDVRIRREGFAGPLVTPAGSAA